MLAFLAISELGEIIMVVGELLDMTLIHKKFKLELFSGTLSSCLDTFPIFEINSYLHQCKACNFSLIPNEYKKLKVIGLHLQPRELCIIVDIEKGT